MKHRLCAVACIVFGSAIMASSCAKDQVTLEQSAVSTTGTTTTTSDARIILNAKNVAANPTWMERSDVAFETLDPKAILVSESSVSVTFNTAVTSGRDVVFEISACNVDTHCYQYLLVTLYANGTYIVLDLLEELTRDYYSVQVSAFDVTGETGVKQIVIRDYKYDTISATLGAGLMVRKGYYK